MLHSRSASGLLADCKSGSWLAVQVQELVKHFYIVLPLAFPLQRQKSTYSTYPKAEPTPVTSSAPPVNTLYSSPVVSAHPPGEISPIAI